MTALAAPAEPPRDQERPARPPAGAVVCRGVTKSFRASGGVVHALRGIDLTVAASTVTMLVGPSGCGKTTLISVVAGILRPDDGTCHVLGTDVIGLAERDRLAFRAQAIGFIFQQFHLLPALTVESNVAIPLLIQGISRANALPAARAILGEVGLADRARDLPGSLSGGEQQRVAIARALVHGPRLIVCDEPTSALDHVTGERIMAMMRRVVVERGTTLLIVTHDNRIFPYADRIARMDDGRIVGVTDGNGQGNGGRKGGAE
jgi:putative ABC transport system ATP-binding protein